MQREKLIVLAGRYVLCDLSEQEAADAVKAHAERIVLQWRVRLADLERVAEPLNRSSDLWWRIVRQLKSPKGDT